MVIYGNSQKKRKNGGVTYERQGIVNSYVRLPQVIPHQTDPSLLTQTYLGRQALRRGIRTETQAIQNGLDRGHGRESHDGTSHRSVFFQIIQII